MISLLPSTSSSNEQAKRMSLGLPPATNSLFKTKHVEFFCGKVPVKILYDKHSGIHFVSIEAASTNLTNVSVNYVTYPFPNGIPNVTSQLVLRGTNGELSADRFEHYYLGNVFSSHSMNIDVQSDYTAFSFDLIGGTSGYSQLLHLLLESLSNTASICERDFKHQICNAEDFTGKLYQQLRQVENQLKNKMDKARFSRTFYGSTHENDYIGSSQDLFTKCTLSKVKHYVRNFYREPWIFLTEKLNSELDLNLLDTLSMKQSFFTKRNRPESTVENYSNLIANKAINDIQFHYSDVLTVYGTYTSDDKGIIQIGFLADPPTNVTFMEASKILSEYLCGDKTSHLNAILANGKDAICSSVTIELKVAPRCEIVVQLNDVLKRNLNKGAVEKFFDALKTIHWDLQNIHEIITRKIKRYSELAEANISSVIFERLRLFQLYADSNDALLLKRFLNPTIVLGEILQFSSVYWKNFIKNLFVENCSVVIGVPDNNSVENLMMERQLTTPPSMNMDRKRKLRRSTELLKDILKPNNVLYSQEIIDVASAPIYPYHKIFPTTLKSFHWNLTGSKLNLLPEWFKSFKELFDPSIPFTVTVHPIQSIESEFVKAVFLFDIKKVDLHLRHYLLIFIKLLEKSASFMNGTYMSANEIDQALKNEVFEHGCKLGFNGNDQYLFQFTLKVSASKLELIEKWFHTILCNVNFDVIDVAKTVVELLKLAQNRKKNEVLYCKTLLDSVNLQKSNDDFFCNEIVLEQFHEELLQSLIEEKQQQVIDNLQALRSQILNSKINLHLVGSPKKFASTHRLNFDDLKRFCANDKVDKIKINPKIELKWPAKPEIHLISNKDSKPLSHLVERLQFDCQPFDETHAAILIFCNYFSKKGGIFWRCVEEDGQAKNVNLNYNVHKQTLTLTIENAKNLKPTRQLISYLFRQMFIDSIDSDLFKVSQRSLAAEIIEPYSNVQSASTASIYNDTYDWTVDQITGFVHKILVIKESRCQYLLYDLIAKLGAEKNLRAISCPSFQINGMVQAFQDILYPNSIIQHTNEKKFELLAS